MMREDKIEKECRLIKIEQRLRTAELELVCMLNHRIGLGDKETNRFIDLMEIEVAEIKRELRKAECAL